MSSFFRQLVNQCRQEHALLHRLLARWTQSNDLHRGALSLSPPPESPFRVAEAVNKLHDAFPGISKAFEAGALFAAGEGNIDDRPHKEPTTPPAADATSKDTAAEPPAQPHPAEQARRRIARNLASLGIEIVGLHGKLLELLADMVIDVHMPRTILLPDDRFHVTGVSVLAAVALANLSYLRANPGADDALIDLPLKAIGFHSAAFRNGDLLFCDLAARSALAADQRGAGGHALSPDSFSPKFLSHSTLAKLDLLFDLPTQQSRLVNLRRWPGLESLVSDPGARSIRRYAVGRLAQRCVANTGLGAIVVGRWFDAMAALDESHQLAAAGLTAHFLWEMLELDVKATKSMASLGKPSQPLLAAVGRIESTRQVQFDPWQPDAPARQFLFDVGMCLDQFDVYHALRQLSRSTGPSPVAAPAMGAST